MKFKSWNKALGIKPEQSTPLAEGRKVVRRFVYDMVLVLSPDKGLFLWDAAPLNYDLCGYAQIKQGVDFVVYQVYVHAALAQPDVIERHLAAFNLTISNFEVWL